MSLNSTNAGQTNAGHMSESDRISGGSGWPSAEGPGLCRRTRQVVAFVIGDRSAKTCARLWSRIPEGYRQGRSFSDFWKSYRPVLSRIPKATAWTTNSLDHQQVGKSSGELAHVERFFGRLRQKLARYVRRTRAASESERMLHLTTKLFVEWYNEAVT